MTDDPQVTVMKALSMQVCVPATYDDDAVIAFAERENPCGTSNGWFIKHDDGADFRERVSCATRTGYVHVVLEA